MGVGPTVRTSRDAYELIMGERPAFPQRSSSLADSPSSAANPPKVPSPDVVSRLSRPTAASAARAVSATKVAPKVTPKASPKTTLKDTSKITPKDTPKTTSKATSKATGASTTNVSMPQSGTMSSFKTAGKGFKNRLSAMIAQRRQTTPVYQAPRSAQGLSPVASQESMVESPLFSPPDDAEAPAPVDEYLSMSRDQLDRLVQASRGIHEQERREGAIQAITAYGEALVAITAARKANMELSAAIVSLSRRTTDLGDEAIAALQG